MKKRHFIIIATIVLIVSLCGCESKSNKTDSAPHTSFLETSMYGIMRIVIWDDESSPINYSEYIQESNEILKAYLKDDYREANIIPFSVIEMYDYPKVPKGMQFNGKIFFNVDETIYCDTRDMIITLVHEQLHFNGKLRVSGLTEEQNITLCEYIVYGLTKKVCCKFDEDLYKDLDYGNAPRIEDLDDSFDELCEIYLGKVKLKKELKTQIIAAFR